MSNVRMTTRWLCDASQEVRRKNAYLLLGLEPGASMREVKKRYWALAKETHPDVLAQRSRQAAAAAASNHGAKVASFDTGVLETDHSAAAAAPTVIPFLEVQAAYDALMEDDQSGAAAKKPGRRPGAAATERARTLGEVLCDRLKDDPDAVGELWEEIVRDKLRVTIPMTEEMLRALRRVAKQAKAADSAVEAARFMQRIIRDGTAYGLINIDTRTSAQVSLLGWCQVAEDELGDLAFEIIDEINDEDRAHSPAVMSAIGSVFCSGTRSPY